MFHYVKPFFSLSQCLINVSVVLSLLSLLYSSFSFYFFLLLFLFLCPELSVRNKADFTIICETDVPYLLPAIKFRNALLHVFFFIDFVAIIALFHLKMQVKKIISPIFTLAKDMTKKQTQFWKKVIYILT